nr:hypothetical protein GCM10020093_103780 [Planobispora longispora]
MDSFFVARPLQETALELVSSGAWPRHLSMLGAELETRRNALAAAVTARLPAAGLHLVPRGGLHLWVRLPPDLDEEAVVEAARREGVLVSPGRIYYPAEPPGPRIRLTHVAAAHLPELAEGVRRLALAVERAAGGSRDPSSPGGTPSAPEGRRRTAAPGVRRRTAALPLGRCSLLRPSRNAGWTGCRVAISLRHHRKRYDGV